MHRAIYQRLKEVAREEDVIFYADVAKIAGLDIDNPGHRWNVLPNILDEISTYEHQQGRPLLSAVVVQKATHRPGKGFFKMARERGCLQEGDDEDAFFICELKRVHEYWKDEGAD